MTPNVIVELSNSCPLARVEHRCIICGTPIAIGSRYLRHVVRNNDMLDKKHNLRVLKYHLSCPITSVMSCIAEPSHVG